MRNRILFLWVIIAGHLFFAGNVSLAEQEKALTIVALGDSTTAGTPWFRSPAEAPPDGLGNPQGAYGYWIMERHPEWQVINKGINGQRSDQILKRVPSDVIADNPQIAIVLAGVNDLFQGYPVDTIEKNLQAIYEQISKEKIRVMTCTILPYNVSTPEVKKRMSEVNEWIRTYSAAHDLGFCDTYRAVENPNHPGRLLSTADDLHPDIEGYKKMGSAIADCLEKWPRKE